MWFCKYCKKVAYEQTLANYPENKLICSCGNTEDFGKEDIKDAKNFIREVEQESLF